MPWLTTMVQRSLFARDGIVAKRYEDQCCQILNMSIVKNFILLSALLVGTNGFAADQSAKPFVVVNTNAEPIASGKFEPSWDSLKQYQCPQWFRDARFGIWAHW